MGQVNGVVSTSGEEGNAQGEETGKDDADGSILF
jgi:hypothetical protein